MRRRRSNPNNPYLAKPKPAASLAARPSDGEKTAEPLQRRDSIKHLEKMGIFLPNTGELLIDKLRLDVEEKIGDSKSPQSSSPTLDDRSKFFNSLPGAPYQTSPNRMLLKPLNARSISPVEGITFESSIRSRKSLSEDLINEKQRVEESNSLRKSMVQRQKEPLLNLEVKKQRSMPKKTAQEKLNSEMGSVYWSPSFSTRHKIPGLKSTDASAQQWVDTYTSEPEFFISKSKWAQVKILEVTQLSEAQRGPSRMLMGVVVQFLLELEERLCKEHPAARVAIEHLLCSLFKSNACIGHLRRVRDRNDRKDKDGVSLDLLNAIMKENSYFEEVNCLRDQIHHEKGLLPGFQKYLDMLKRQQAAEKRSLELTVKRWQQSMLLRIFVRWRDSVKKQKRAAKMLGTYFFNRKQIGLKQIWKEWRILFSRAKYDKERNWEEHAMAQCKEYQKDLAEVREKTMHVMMEIDNVSSAAADLEQKLADALEILHDPARQPPTLRKVIVALTSAVKVGGDMAMLACHQNSLDYFRKDADCYRLSTMHLNALSKSELTPHEYHKEVREEEDIEKELLSWVPGSYNSIEKTPAFQPFETRDGMLLLQWVNYQLRTEPARSILLALERTKNGKKKKKAEGKLLEVPDDLTDCSIYAALNRYTLIPALQLKKKRFLEENMLSAHKEHTAASQDEEDENKNEEDPYNFVEESESFNEVMEKRLYNRAEQVLQEIKDADDLQANQTQDFHQFKPVELPIGRFITAADITGIPREPTPEEIAKQEARMARLAARQNESGIIVHIMSRYCGMRIHVEGREVPLKFALLVAILSKSDGALCLPKEMEDREVALLDEATQKWNDNRAAAMKLAAKGQLAFQHADLEAMNAEMEANLTRVRKILVWKSKNYMDAIPDKRRWNQFRDRLTYLMWQSVCTTVLSRKVKIEEDIDDGSFTTIDKQQLVGSVFKREKIHEDDDAMDEIIAKYVGLCKHRIRDFKRIFQYYAAAEAGDANSMDHAEFWKFVRECKFQKDRAALPSVRVDLIFQACNIDYSLAAADRKASDDGEMDSNEWVECLTRTSSWRYSKKTAGDLAKRLVKLVNDDMLPNACSVDCDVFRERLAGDEVQAVYKKHKKNTKKIYLVYAADDDDGDAALAMDTMNCKELVSFCMEMKLAGPILSQRMIRTMFAFVQQEEADLDDDEDDDDGSEMVYSEFMEALSAIAMVLVPNPYEVVPTRIDRFVKKILLPAARDNPKTTKIVK